jgi:hypothetical protein
LSFEKEKTDPPAGKKQCAMQAAQPPTGRKRLAALEFQSRLRPEQNIFTSWIGELLLTLAKPLRASTQIATIRL